ncbi:hypothetical protein KC19_6G079800 [Ceratodon purpureus]|uniref:HTH myb-type domain-containing protein n=1 Tax=Ceratodon purpureus TaxID=3225 RepID=A0A8T0HBX7_CERPU|nr:hypothetical protein KC19_6G079800 [Ceratodon purpureus]KAG0569283.1 hypothetical protein KC19_6G079800 [Ceratodon purpureus]
MAWGPNGRRASRTAEAVLDYPEEKSSRVATINAENSALVERFRRDRANVRPYVRTSTQKLKWTHELHQCFMHAVEKLGGQDKATPKKILLHMNQEGITIAHIKSHLQMFRSGKINAEGLSKSEYKTWQGGQWLSNNTESMPGPATSSRPAATSPAPAQNLLRFDEFEPVMALIQLREDSGRSNSDSGAATASDLLTLGSPDSQANYDTYVHKKSKAIQQLQQDKLVVELNERLSPHREQQLHQQDMGQSSTYRPQSWPPPSCDSFLYDEPNTSTSHPVDIIDALSGSKRKTDQDVDIELTMATRSIRPSFQFPSPPTPEEANLNLALS